MPQFLEWIASNFFIVVVIIGVLFSVFSKKNKPANGGGEPFGGRNATPRNPGNPQQRRVQPPSNERQSPFSGAPTNTGNQRRPAPQDRGNMGAERTNLEQASRQMNDEVEKRLREQPSMQQRRSEQEGPRRQNQRTSSLTSRASSQLKVQESTSNTAPASSLLSNPTANDLRKGILWAEVLGEPRAKKKHSSGRT
ncbi:hypothetical protein [Saccharibacillus sp. JS10]|uniref:hypothetical protein n=1 Tax=Saccharibacillus sp. JS10 TaxID=2950552 RepID=UPI00210C703E|nr:hypothetical protein [Saccharibacillus sp. JS10]MCQ4086147.1 hypothetical protein [Saccharibacillus sp. JS10]